MRRDFDIRQDVEAAINTDVRLSPSNVSVDVVNGVVYLRGSVPTFDQQMAAASDAWVVKAVIDVVTELTVAPYARATY